MKVLLILLAALAAVLLIVAAIGACLPRTHVASRTASFRQPISVLYATVRNFAAEPQWRAGIDRVEMLPAQAGLTSFREISRHGSIPFVVLKDTPNETLVTQIADQHLPFGGTWTFTFATTPDGGSLRITENGFVNNVFFRFMSRTFFSPTTTMETYLRDLGKKFGESTLPQP